VILTTTGDSVGEVLTSIACPTTPAWSPDKTHIAFGQCGSGAIRVIGADGQGEYALPYDGYPRSNPGWTPDGTQLVYIRSFAFSNLVINNVEGTNERFLTTRSDEAVSDLAVSPDGTRIIFTRRPSSGGPGDIFIINIDGTGERLLVQNSAYKSHARWSPDGTEIVYFDDVSQSLKVVASAGGTPRELVTSGSVGLSGPDWTW
jgi:Tol biopolymer transport system component